MRNARLNCNGTNIRRCGQSSHEFDSGILSERGRKIFMKFEHHISPSRPKTCRSARTDKSPFASSGPIQMCSPAEAPTVQAEAQGASTISLPAGVLAFAPSREPAQRTRILGSVQIPHFSSHRGRFRRLCSRPFRSRFQRHLCAAADFVSLRLFYLDAKHRIHSGRFWSWGRPVFL